MGSGSVKLDGAEGGHLWAANEPQQKSKVWMSSLV